MITCQYCGASYQEFQTTCSGCGATLQPQKNIMMNANAPARIRQICEAYEDARNFLPGNAIPEKRLQAAKDMFKTFPNNQEIFLFCDTHPLKKGEKGFIISEDGLYWQNSWSTSSNRNYLSWEDFAKREPGLKKFTLELGRGDAIGLAGMGNEERREKVLRLLTEIKNTLQEYLE